MTCTGAARVSAECMDVDCARSMGRDVSAVSDRAWMLLLVPFFGLDFLLDSYFYTLGFALMFCVGLRVLIAYDRRGSDAAAVALQKIGVTPAPSFAAGLHSGILWFGGAVAVELLIEVFDRRLAALGVLLVVFIGAVAGFLYSRYLKRSERRQAEAAARQA